MSSSIVLVGRDHAGSVASSKCDSGKWKVECVGTFLRAVRKSAAGPGRKLIRKSRERWTGGNRADGIA